MGYFVSISISNSVEHSVVLAPTLFSIFFSIMLREAKENLPDGTYTSFRTDGNLLNLRRLLACMKTVEELITELLFADDCALLAHTEDSTSVVNRFSDAAKNFSLAISPKKTEMLHTPPPPPREAYSPPQTSINSTNVNAVEDFTYLSILSSDASVSKNFDNGLFKASSSFGRRSKRV